MMNRREFLQLAGVSALSGVSILSGCTPVVDRTTTSSTSTSKPVGGGAHFSLHIAPVKLELSPDQVIQTIGYNGIAPGPVLRIKEGQQVTVEVHNDSDVPELVHWHGLYVSSEVDGAMEEGTPMVPSRGSRQYFFHCSAKWNPLVSYPRFCRQRSTPEPVFRTVWILPHRIPKTILVDMTKRSLSRRISGIQNSSACRI